MNKTFFEEVFEEAFEKGKADGIRALVLEDLEECFGIVPEFTKQRLQEKSIPEMKLLLKRIHQARSLADLGLDK